MKKLLFLIIAMLVIIGCSNGGSSKSDSKDDVNPKSDSDNVKENDETQISDSDNIVENDNDEYCGDNKVNSNETCDGGTKDCTEIDSNLYASGTASCKSDCSGWDTINCVKKTGEPVNPPLNEQYFPLVDGKQAFTEETISGKVVVNDPVTKLMWAKEFIAGKNWQASIDYCENLVYGDYDDWRLPTAHELISLLDYTKYSPASSFPDMPSSWFWSSSVDAKDSSSAWIVYFDYGYVQSNDKEKTGTYRTRCVRGGYSGITEERFTVNGDIVVDNVTKLMWTKEYISDKTWQDAIDYCENLVYGDYDDWRLPTVHELGSLVHHGKYEPASNFPDMSSEYFWSSSDYACNSDSAWFVNFSNGYLDHIGKYIVRNVRCVRGKP